MLSLCCRRVSAQVCACTVHTMRSHPGTDTAVWRWSPSESRIRGVEGPLRWNGRPIRGGGGGGGRVRRRRLASFLKGRFWVRPDPRAMYESQILQCIYLATTRRRGGRRREEEKNAPISFRSRTRPRDDLLCGWAVACLLSSPLLSPEFTAPMGHVEFRPSLGRRGTGGRGWEGDVVEETLYLISSAEERPPPPLPPATRDRRDQATA
ncbi:hypothetical protein GGS23DRAFT_339214 [Durotheca rogersii]|uniref:uncharacterized protein n=1 Tax=Durotheca rogersii TaxID=419775 RepID=UPI00221F7D36|nr:uncharacterized protein GGS23DRAFT_339214 [Durotheca rogersii]KAI5858221.1 hypothetical protein GGS23DRAFT_339214 [Durotheca rogersii]